MPALAFDFFTADTNGTLTATITGGTPGYTYSVDGAPFQAAGIAFNAYFASAAGLALGSHAIVARDSATPYAEITRSFDVEVMSVAATCSNTGSGNAQGNIEARYNDPGGYYVLASGPSGYSADSRNATPVFQGVAVFVFLGNGGYTLGLYDSSDNLIESKSATISCGNSAPLNIDSIATVDASAAGVSDGTATAQITDGMGIGPAFSVETHLGDFNWLAAMPTTANAYAASYTGLAAGLHTMYARDTTLAVTQRDFTITVAVVPVSGCMDEYASDYDPDATVAGACTFVPRWRSAWQDMAVRVAAVQGQTEAFIEAHLFIGFRPGHPLAADRPLSAPITLRATVSPRGYARFLLGQPLRTALGEPTEDGFRLNINSPTAFTTDLFVGYELRRTTGEMLEHGYALNSAEPDEELHDGLRLSPFEKMPIWPGYDDYSVAHLSSTSAGRYGSVTTTEAAVESSVTLACPNNPVPVAWLAPMGGFGYWIFQGRSNLGDEVGDGQTFNEAGTGERRFSQRGEARRTIAASTGIYDGHRLLEGLRTLSASPQVWYQPGGPSTPWVPVTLESGSFPAGRLGSRRQEARISFTEAQPRNAQGQ